MRQSTTRSGTEQVLTSTQLAELRERLEEQRRFRVAQLDELRTIDPDRTSEVAEVLEAGARVALHDIIAALHRMDSGSYGRCVACGEAIPLARLEVIPAVSECLPCRTK